MLRDGSSHLECAKTRERDKSGTMLERKTRAGREDWSGRRDLNPGPPLNPILPSNSTRIPPNSQEPRFLQRLAVTPLLLPIFPTPPYPPCFRPPNAYKLRTSPGPSPPVLAPKFHVQRSRYAHRPSHHRRSGPPFLLEAGSGLPYYVYELGRDAVLSRAVRCGCYAGRCRSAPEPTVARPG